MAEATLVMMIVIDIGSGSDAEKVDSFRFIYQDAT